MISLKKRLSFIKQMHDIPAMPVIVANLLTKLNDPKITLKEIDSSISLDPALVSYILRIINSPFYNVKSEVLTVPKALSLLGISNLKSLLIGYGIQSVYSNLQDNIVQKHLWEHAISVGILAKIISEEVYFVVHTEVYVYGLLHDIGKIVLYMHNPDEFKKTIDLEENNIVESQLSNINGGNK